MKNIVKSAAVIATVLGACATMRYAAKTVLLTHRKSVAEERLTKEIDHLRAAVKGHFLPANYERLADTLYTFTRDIKAFLDDEPSYKDWMRKRNEALVELVAEFNKADA
jgi:hypothetical protein